jgi:predicted transcriptional regulator YdeE
MEKINSKKIVGLVLNTTNEPNRYMKEIPEFWERFMSENQIEQIENKVDAKIYAVYYDYQFGEHLVYKMMIGCEVSDFSKIKELELVEIESGSYEKFESKGNIQKGSVHDTWEQIWSSNIDRTFLTDFEVYDERSYHPEQAIVDVFIGIKD